MNYPAGNFHVLNDVAPLKHFYRRPACVGDGVISMAYRDSRK